MENKLPVWFNILVGIYLGLNMLFGAVFIAMPMVVVGPSFVFSASQMALLIIIFYIIKVWAAWWLFTGKRNRAIPVLLVLGCLWSTWFASPYYWGNWSTRLLILDWAVLVFSIYFLTKGFRSRAEVR